MDESPNKQRAKTGRRKKRFGEKGKKTNQAVPEHSENITITPFMSYDAGVGIRFVQVIVKMAGGNPDAIVHVDIEVDFEADVDVDECNSNP